MTDLPTSIAKGDARAVINALGELAEQVSGAKLVTVTIVDPVDGSAGREWTNMPEAYPVSGRKPMNPTHWSDQVITRKQNFVANTIEEIAEVFFDHELIQSLGCESVLNLPIVVSDRVVATINMLDVTGYWTPERIAKAETLRVPGAAALLFTLLPQSQVAA